MVHFLQCSSNAQMPSLPVFIFFSILLLASMEVAHSDARSLPLKLLENIASSKQEEEGRGGGAETVKMERRMLIGSRPPRCERVCMSCGHCEAVQVPIVPQDHRRGGGHEQHHVVSAISAAMFTTYRVNGLSNYKPLSWKCKCGGIILDP